MTKKRMILSFLKANFWLVMLSVLINALSGFTRTKGAQYLGLITDVIGLKQINALYTLAITGAVIMVSSYVFRWLGASLCQYLAKKLSFETRKKLISHLESISFLDFEALSAGDIQSVIVNDTEEASNILYNVLSRILNNVFLFIFSVIYMLSISLEVTLVVVCIAIAMGFLNARLLKLIKKEKSESRKSLGRLSVCLESNYKAADTIKSYNAQAYVKSAYGKQRDVYSSQMLNCDKLDGIRLTIYNIINNIALYGSMVYMGFLGINGVVTVSQAVVLIYLTKQILVPIEVIFRWMFHLASSIAAWERIEKLFELEACRDKSAQVTLHDVKIGGLTFSYDGNKTMFESIGELNLKPGHVYFLQGSSGSGKTTLLKLIMGLYKNKTLKINDFENLSLEGQCAYSSADFELFDMSVYENIALGDSSVTRQMCCEMFEKLGFNDFADKLDAKVIKGGVNFSGGQKQMIVNARALLSNRKIIVLDEPFSALDKEHEAALLKVLKEDGRIIIITSHRNVEDDLICEKICVV